MPTTHNYDIVTELSGEANLTALMNRILADGTYTGPCVSSVDADTVMVTVLEDSVTKGALEAILDVTDPTMSLDKTSVTVTADGVDTDTVTVTDSRGAGASGVIVKLTWPGVTYADTNSLTLDGSGQGTITLGPCPSGECTSSTGLVISFISGDANVAPVSCLVKYE